MKTVALAYGEGLWYDKKRNVGETISLMFDIDNPKNYHVIGDYTTIMFFLPFLIYILYKFINYLIKWIVWYKKIVWRKKW